MWTIGRYERRLCPDEFQECINERFGLNRFGGPNFKLVWGQTEYVTMAGNGCYQDELLCHGNPCWNILRWIPPETFGTPDFFYEQSIDPETGLSTLGEYPHEGRYEILQPLTHRQVIGDELIVEHFPLSYQIIDLMIPMFVRSQEVTALELRLAQEEQERMENAEIVDSIADRLEEEMPAYVHPVSYAGQAMHTSRLTRKMDEISRQWDRLPKRLLREPKKGFFQLPN